MRGALMLAAILTGCAAPVADTGAVSVVWHKVEPGHVWADCIRLEGRDCPATTKGFTIMRNGVCHVYVVDKPDGISGDDSDYGTLGHELKHCVDGKFHTKLEATK